MLKLMNRVNENNEGEICQRNKDCESNICKMLYKGGQPYGRRCLRGNGNKYTIDCKFPRDCLSGICEPIYDNDGKFVARKCAKAPKLRGDNPVDAFLNKESSYEKQGNYGVLNNHAIKMKLEQRGKSGPVTETIIKIISIVCDLFSIIVYNFSKPSYDHANQGVMYSLLASISLGVFSILRIPGGLISGLSAEIHDDGTGKCDANTSRPIDMFYIRTFITILFPPLGVLMAKGFTGFSYVLLSCLLTAIFYFPGLIYSLAIISSSRYGKLEAAEREKGRGE
jgi:uncharacterized membrane protein YqaE (UPF0057 family)